MRPLVLVGGGGHCKSVIDVALSSGYSIAGILDRPDNPEQECLGFPVIGTDDDIPRLVKDYDFVITVGQIKSVDLRVKLYNIIKQSGGSLPVIIASTAYVSKFSNIEEGTVIHHHATVNADAKIGKCCIINTASNIEHDVKIDEFCHISTGVMVNGGCHISKKTFVGSGSVLRQGVSVVPYTIIGAGSIVARDINQCGTYVGIPAKKLS